MNRGIRLVDENGVEKEFRYLFEVMKKETNEPYVFFMEVNAPRPEVVVYKFDHEGNMKDLESQEEWEYAQRAFNSYVSQMHGGCGGCHGGCHDGDDCSCDGNCEGDCDCNH